MRIPAKDREIILREAKIVRLAVDKEGHDYGTIGMCGDATLVLSKRLFDAGIPHKIATGTWYGPVDDRFYDAYFAKYETGEFGGEVEEPEFLHEWIVFPLWDHAILDITADQFADLPSIYFPGNPKNYMVNEFADPATLRFDLCPPFRPFGFLIGETDRAYRLFRLSKTKPFTGMTGVRRYRKHR